MRLQTLLIVASACLCGVGLLATLGGGASANPLAAPIPLQEIQTRGIEGRLGFRLGTVISVAGQIIPNSSRAKADVDEPFFVRVEEANGKPLDSPVDYPARVFPLNQHIKSLKVGDAFSCTGYETGGYEGVADVPSGTAVSVAGVGYGFVVHFHVFNVR